MDERRHVDHLDGRRDDVMLGSQRLAILGEGEAGHDHQRRTQHLAPIALDMPAQVVHGGKLARELLLEERLHARETRRDVCSQRRIGERARHRFAFFPRALFSATM